MSEFIKFFSSLEFLPEMHRWIRDKLKGVSLSSSEKNKLEVACEEIFVNIISYAYGEEEGEIEICFNLTPQLVSFAFKDKGKEFNPLKKEKPVIKSLSVDSKDIGGLGIFFVKSIVDKIDYKYVDGSNILTISKNLFSYKKN
jgi:anti-sigma regulatory factor (Ser/Thr protein kinase)